MKYKLFSIDLDGTLLSKTKRISKKNISALVEYKKNGGEIVIATGRSIISAMKYVNKLNNFNLDIKYLITFNGAKIINLKDKNEINTTISHNVVAKVVNAIKEFNCAAWIYSINSTNNGSVIVTGKFFTGIFAALSKQLKLQKIKKVKDSLESYKIFIYGYFSSTLDKITKKMEKEFSDLEIIKHGKYSLEITNKNVTKWNALKNVCQNYKVLENEIACIGDSNNDLECIKNCGFSFSITKKNKEIIENSDINFKKQKNAVAKAINNYLLKI